MFETKLVLDIEHQYFADFACSGLRLRPDAATAKLFQRAEFVCRASEQRVVVSIDRNAGTLDQLIGAGSLLLHFLAVGTSQHWQLFTSLDLVPSHKPPSLDMRGETTEGERRRLHALETVRQQDFVSAHDDKSEKALSPGEPLAYFTLTLPLRADVEGAVQYVLRFSARSTQWRYNIIGSLSDDISIVDAAQAQTFNRDDDATLPDGRKAIRFVSVLPLSLQQKPHQHFQLVAGPEHDRDVLIDRLPLADVGRLAEGGTISEIYVHT